MSGDETGAGPGPESLQAFLPEAPPYWLRYSGRLVRFGTLDGATRLLAIAGAGAAILGLLVLVLPLAHMRAVAMPALVAQIRVPVLVLVIASVLQAAGWCYLVAGASLGGMRVRLPVAVALLAFVFTAAPGAGPTMLVTAALAAYLVATAWRPPSPALARSIAAVGVSAIFALMLRSGAAIYALTLLNETVVAYLLLVPVIFYSGYDLGQTALHGVRLALLHTHGRVGLPLLAAVTGAVVVAKIVVLLAVEHAPSASFLLALPVLAAALLLSRHLGPEEERPPELMPALAALLVLGAIFGSGGLGRIWADAAAASLVAGVVVAARAWRVHALAQAAVFLIIFGLWNMSNVITVRVGGPLGLLAGWRWPIDARGLDEAVVLSALAYGAWLVVRKDLTTARLMLILFWLVGMSLVLGLWSILTGLEHLAHGALAGEAILLAIGIGHEVAASGGLLNRGSRAVPRSSRVLLYLGYLLIVCGSTVIADGSAGPTAGAIQSDALQEGGLILVGIPLYLQMFAHALAVGREPTRQEEAAEPAPAAASGAPAPAS